MSYCCVPRCKSYQRNEKDKHLSFHRFPGDPKLCRQWIVNIKRDIGPNFQITDNTRVCSKHFEAGCIARSLVGLHKLKRGSLPTLFAWSSEPKPARRRKLERNPSMEDSLTAEEELESCSLSNQHTGEGSNYVLGPLQDHDYIETSPPIEEQLTAARKEIARLTKENESLRKRLKSLAVVAEENVAKDHWRQWIIMRKQRNPARVDEGGS